MTFSAPSPPRSVCPAPAIPAYAELQVSSHFSFLRAASSCEDLFAQAALLGIKALGLADRHSLAGMVRAFQAAEKTGVRLVVGCRIDLVDGPAVLVYPTDRAAYGRLCRLLTLGKSRAGKGRCHLAWTDLETYGEGQIVVLLPEAANDDCLHALRRLKTGFGNRAYCALTLKRRPNDALRLHHISTLAAKTGVPTVVTNDVLYHHPSRRLLHDVMTCIRHGVTIDDLGDRRDRSADRYLKPPRDMHRLFARYPDALRRTMEIAERCRFSPRDLAYQYPKEETFPGMTPQQTLEKLTWDGACGKYPGGIPAKVRASLDHELGLIGKLSYAPYFLTVHAIVRFARSRGILCQGRGSAANSAVCFALGITSIDPRDSDLLFERFISEERDEPPDIDVDFEHERRETVMQWVFDHYGRDHAALCAVVISYRSKGALRDVGKAMGLSEDVIRQLSPLLTFQSRRELDTARLADSGLNPEDRRLRLTLELAQALIGTPRHLSQHPGGFVLTHDRLDDLVPIEPAAMADRQVIEWDKDDIDALKFMKVDCLALGMLSCLKKAFDFLAQDKNIVMGLEDLPPHDEPTFAMIRRADTIGVFQIESRAQMSMLPRLKPKKYYDLVIQVAIVRPGPIQGDMVHPYLRRRNGDEEVRYPKPELKAILEKTLGVPLFQEQAMRIAIEGAGFTGGEADQLRKSMATFKRNGSVNEFEEKLIRGLTANGYDEAFATTIFKQLQGFGHYGFPESHAASFARLAYASAWMKCHHPDVFCAALLNAQPMGFYAPAQIVGDARDHGVEIRPVCVNASRWDCTLEPAARTAPPGRCAVRLGFRLVKGLANAQAASLVLARQSGPYVSIDDVWRRSEVPVSSLGRLAEADGFQNAFGLGRREALWALKGLRDTPLPLFEAAALKAGKPLPELIEDAVALRPMTAAQNVFKDYSHLGLSLRPHPLSFLRPDLTRRNILTCAAALDRRDGSLLTVAGLILIRQRPATAKGVLFLTMEDETGTINVVVWKNVFDTFRLEILTGAMVAVTGCLQKEGEVVHLVARRIENRTVDLALLQREDGDALPDQAEPFTLKSRDFQ